MKHLLRRSMLTCAALSATVLLSQSPSLLTPALTVRVIETSTGKPLRGVQVIVRYNFLEPRKAKKIELFYAKTDPSGTARFSDLPAPSECLSVSVWSVGVGNDELEPVICPAGQGSGLSNPTLMSLPQSVVIHAHRRRFGERLQMIFPGP